MKAKRRMLISMLAIVFVLLAVVATVAIAFALTQQTITTTLNIGYTVEDIDGSASATYTIGGVTESLTAMKGDTVLGETLYFHADDTEDAGNLMFPAGQIPLSAQNDNIVIQYTYSNTGAKHYIASMSFDGNISADNMKVEYSIDGTTYSENRYAVVVPAHSANKSYWIRISIYNKAKSASFTGNFNWLLSSCDPQEDSYLSLTSVEFQGSNGSYSASLANTGSYVGELVFPRSVNNDPVTTIAYNTSLTQAQKNQVTSVYIPDSVETIGYNAFASFENLQTVTFEQNETGSASVQNGSGLKTLETYAFGLYGGLKEIILPNTVENIAFDAFSCADKITSLKVAEGGSVYRSVNNCIIHIESKRLVRGCLTSVIPNDGSVEIIGKQAFDGILTLKSLIIPNHVKTIEGLVFAGCMGLTNVEIPASVTTMSNDAPFMLCLNLKNITTHTLNDSVVEAIKSLANTNGEMNLIIGDNITSIPMGTFADCTGLTKVVITGDVKSFRMDSFIGCTNLKVIDLGDSVVSFTRGTLAEPLQLDTLIIGKSLTTLDYEGNFLSYIKNVVVSAENTTFAMVNNCFINKTTKTLLRLYEGGTIPVDGSVQILGSYSLAQFGEEIFVIPNTIIKLEELFLSGSQVVHLTIPESVTSIDSLWLQGALNLETIQIDCQLTNLSIMIPTASRLKSFNVPASVVSMSFSGIDNVESIIFENPNGWVAVPLPIVGTQNINLATSDLQNPTTAANIIKEYGLAGYNFARN